MRLPMAAPLAAALLLSLATSACAAAVISPISSQPPLVHFNGPEGPSTIYAPDASTAALVQQITAGLAAAAQTYVTGVAPSLGVTISSAPPANISVAKVAQVIGSVMAAVSAEAAARHSLGDPGVFPYTDGTNRIALYRLPRGKPKGTCIFVHGCKHDPYSWFYKSKGCPKCTGLPEEVSHTKQCLAHGYAVLALMSLNREYRSRCFSSSGGPDQNDQASAAVLVTRFLNKFGLMRQRKYIFGISSGAAFAIKFPLTMWVDGVVSEVNMPWEKSWGATDGRGHLKTRFPPTVYYMMKRDLQTKRQIEQAVEILKNNGVPSDYVYVDSRPVTRTWLSERSVYISPEQSAQIWAALVKSKVISRSGDVLYDVRVNRKWVKQLGKILPWLKRSSPYYNLISDESQIWQELNVAWAWHEIVSDYVRPTLIWLDKKGRANLNALVKQYDLGQNIACLSERKEGCRRRM